jgi:hypothetical protein
MENFMKALVIIALALCSSTVFAASCRDGEVQYFQDPANQGGDAPQEIRIVCKNGSFFAPTAPLAVSSCKEGETNYWQVGDGESSDSRNATFVCHNGVFTERNAPATTRRAPTRCREGKVDVFTSGGDDSGAPYVREVYECRNGHVRRIR